MKNSIAICLIVLFTSSCGLYMANDYSTTPKNPPVYDKLAWEDEALNYQPEHIKAHSEYPYLRPLYFKAPASEVFASITELASERWEVVSVDASKFKLEAVASTKILRFKDDVVIEVRKAPDGVSSVHMRSRSRLGKWDMGANAKRIKEFISALADVVSAEEGQHLKEQSRA